ncbi:putative cystathionine gamma-lyase 2 [Chrysoperla carnea]|uniref:putative cystathionine gamma-lyase 2 n=1 Tax=Chrysoperla carnea TaxID=189513 RepID=UPI001D074326|nr:putative cystathionine gamma-lyase 2 [Chrysoperla carnea]XP_044731168.1 putative cystathionine gamma-lyase 2 [Chrysoperla carnea]
MSDNNEFLPLDETYGTKALFVGSEAEQWNSLATVPPITMSTVFKQASLDEPQEFLYGRFGNPSRKVMEKCIAALECGKYCYSYASGLGAIHAIFTLLNAGDHVIVGDDIYGGSNALINKIFKRIGLETSFVDTTDLSNVEKAFKPNTKLIFIESPTNPTLKVTDLEEIAKLAKSRNILTAIDNTFLTSYFQKPLNFGFDIVMHSCTKYIGGHSDVTMGVLITNCEKLASELEIIQMYGGSVPSPFDCFLVQRSLKTLSIRMDVHQKNGYAVAKFLEKHPLIEKVVHPGLPSHPQYEITKKQTSGHSGMICFYIKDAEVKQTKKFLTSLKMIILGGSVGGVKTLAQSPSIISHRQMPREEKLRLGITDNCIRLSIGIESVKDLTADLDQALKAAFE